MPLLPCFECVCDWFVVDFKVICDRIDSSDIYTGVCMHAAFISHTRDSKHYEDDMGRKSLEKISSAGRRQIR